MAYWVGITGGSASGKTYLLNVLRAALPPDKATFISMDHYYKDREQIPREPDGQINFDKPHAIDFDKFYQDLLALRRGEAVQQREYTFNNPLLEPRILTFRPAKVVVVEGLFLFYSEPIRALFDLRIFMEAEEPLRFLRRLARDQEERGYPAEVIIQQYLGQVLPAYQQFVEPLRRFAHVVIYNSYDDLSPAVRLITDHLLSVVLR